MITSRDNDRLKLVRKLRSRRWREKLGLFVVEGEDLVEAGAAAGLEPVDVLVAGDDVAPELLAGLSELAHAPRVLAVYRTADLPAAATRPATLALWRVADPGNLGTLLRTADAFGAGLSLSAGCADRTGPKALRASAGAVFRVPVGPFDDAPAPRIGLVAHGGRALGDVALNSPVTFVLGSERTGLPDEVAAGCDELATIPVERPAESLNVATAGGIALWGVGQVPVVSLISIAPVKSLGLHHPQSIDLTRDGALEDRRLYLVDDRGRLYNGTRHGPLVQVRPEYDDAGGRLSLAFPGGRTVAGDVALGEELETDFWGRPVRGRLVDGPWAAALSAYAGASIRLVRAERAGDGTDVDPATIVSEESCAELARHAGAPVDPRRFRMLLTLTGCRVHEEDEWESRPVRIGAAVVRVGGPVPRCVVTTQDPATGVTDLDMLRAIADSRGRIDGQVPFGVYAVIEEPGRVRVGDPVEPL